MKNETKTVQTPKITSSPSLLMRLLSNDASKKVLHSRFDLFRFKRGKQINQMATRPIQTLISKNFRVVGVFYNFEKAKVFHSYMIIIMLKTLFQSSLLPETIK